MKESTLLQKQYENLGICREVYDFGSRIEEELKNVLPGWTRQRNLTR